MSSIKLESAIASDSVSRKHHDVTVIGAGWSGLVACKYMKEEGLSVIALEKRDGIGGVWLYSDDPNTTTVMKTTRCTSSSTMTEMSDFPMPEEIGMFPHHTDILKYLHSYADNFNLMPHILLNTCVKKAEKKGEIWCVQCENGDEYTSNNLVVTTGQLHLPNRDLENTVLKDFTGKIYHASEIKEVSKEHEGKRLLIVGGGETGSDLCMDFYAHSEFIYWSIPRGQHFFKKVGKTAPWHEPDALDKSFSRIVNKLTPFARSKPGLAWLCKWTTAGSVLAYKGHGIPEWHNDAEFFHNFINKNGKVLDFVDYKHLVPKAGITHCVGNEVYFTDGTRQEFDTVILSTGYKKGFPFLPKHYTEMSMSHHYKFVFDIQDPSISFVGFWRPVVGSVVAGAELQARWVARVYSKVAPLKPLNEREADRARDIAHYGEYFKNSSQRLESLTELFTYTDDVAKLAGVYPDYWALFKRRPYHWYVAYFAPYNAATFRLNEPKYEDQAIATMKTHNSMALNVYNIMLLLFLRIIWFDWILYRLGYLKYKIQMSQWWKVVRDWRIIRVANWVWTRPKKIFYEDFLPDHI